MVSATESCPQGHVPSGLSLAPHGRGHLLAPKCRKPVLRRGQLELAGRQVPKSGTSEGTSPRPTGRHFCCPNRPSCPGKATPGIWTMLPDSAMCPHRSTWRYRADACSIAADAPAHHALPAAATAGRVDAHGHRPTDIGAAAGRACGEAGGCIVPAIGPRLPRALRRPCHGAHAEIAGAVVHR